MSRPSYLQEFARRFGGEVCGDCVRIPTPGHGPKDRGTSVKLRADGRGVVVFAFNNPDWRDVKRQLGLLDDVRAGRAKQTRALPSSERLRLARQLAEEKAQREAEQLARVKGLVGSGEQVTECSPVFAYLHRARGVPEPVIARVASAGSILAHRSGLYGVCMLALAYDSARRLRAVQLTKLKPDGSAKRGTSHDRLTFGPVKGAACRPAPVDGDVLAVAEGLESAVSFTALFGAPCWATFGADNLVHFDPPAGVRRILIASDGDAPGRNAANALFERLRHRCRVIVSTAPADRDWNDVLLSEARNGRV